MTQDSIVPEIKIDHLSWRVCDHRSSEEFGENKFIVYNIVFSVLDEEQKSYPLSLSEDYTKSLAWTYKPGILDIIEKPKLYRSKQLDVWVTNPTQILRYIEKFDKFQAREWVEYNPVTIACLEALKQLKQGQEKDFAKDWQGMTAHSGKFYRLLHTLDTWWD